MMTVILMVLILILMILMTMILVMNTFHQGNFPMVATATETAGFKWPVMILM